jgi:hypothetical protein
VVLLISASGVDRITGVNHQYLDFVRIFLSFSLLEIKHKFGLGAWLKLLSGCLETVRP